MQLHQLLVFIFVQLHLVQSASLTSQASHSRTEFTIPGDHKFVPNQTQAMVRIDVKHGKDSSIPECALTALNLNEDIRPPRDTCCRSAADYCLVAECSPEPMTYCEAEARCLARGLQAASRSFHENVDTVDPTKLGTDEYYFWVNVYQEQDDVWKWQDDGSDLSDFFWCALVTTTTTATPTIQLPTSPANCAAIHFTDKPHKIEYYRTQCTGTEVKCILCTDLYGTLPAC